MKKPNILFLISHDTGRYLGCYDRPVKSPEIDRLASSGVRFDQAFCPTPTCSPSRGSILTGLYPHNNGLIGLAHYEFGINEDVSTLPMALQQGGYETTLIGFSHETIGHTERGTYSSNTKLGYQRYEKIEGSRAPQVADKAIEYLKEKSKDSSKPFFANIGFWETHRTFDEYEPFADEIEEVTVPEYLPDTEKVRKEIALMNGSVKVLDEAIGRIINTLKETGLDENTILIYTTDHGIAFPRAKGTMKEAGLETALIFYSPMLFGENVTTNEIICNIDLMPTILDLAGLPIPENLDGKSFAPFLLKETEATERNEFFFELTWHDNYHPMRGVRTKKYKYVRNFEDGPEIYLPMDIHKSPSGEEVRQKFYVPNAKEELYDLEKDPLEETNLIENPHYATIGEELRAKVNNWMEKTNDPLLNGRVPGVASKSWALETEKGNAYKGRK
ncbi:sulfatase family protein [Metabacillus bambusae]|uniref:Sulfatase n=1 Tax=Metabacillus bambusae TaxID=2795218 RepID=A0ABS3N7E7_9BACI|nr:sulfatase [Metabacillus bambusae]MBO1514070.1 sulfatase [Metabacillus bambusae]